MLKTPTLSKKSWSEVSSIFNKLFIKKIVFTSTKKFLVKDTSKKLQFFVDDLSLDNFVKTNLIWQLQSILPSYTGNTLSNYVFTYTFV